MHRVRSRRQLAAVRELWQAREQLAQRRDISPGRILPDAAIVAAATGAGRLAGPDAGPARLPRRSGPPGRPHLVAGARSRPAACPDTALPGPVAADRRPAAGPGLGRQGPGGGGPAGRRAGRAGRAGRGAARCRWRTSCSPGHRAPGAVEPTGRPTRRRSAAALRELGARPWQVELDRADPGPSMHVAGPLPMWRSTLRTPRLLLASSIAGLPSAGQCQPQPSGRARAPHRPRRRVRRRRPYAVRQGRPEGHVRRDPGRRPGHQVHPRAAPPPSRAAARAGRRRRHRGDHADRRPGPDHRPDRRPAGRAARRRCPASRSTGCAPAR